MEEGGFFGEVRGRRWEDVGEAGGWAVVGVAIVVGLMEEC